MNCSQKKIFVVATCFLILGISCYAFIYPNKFHSISLGGWQIELYKLEIQSKIFLAVIYTFTSFCHVVFMTFYSLSITGNMTFRGVVQWGFFWGITDSFFEIMQLKEKLENSVRSDFGLLNKVNHYLENGHFDLGDVIAIWIGVAFVIIIWHKRCRTLEESKAKHSTF